MKSSGVPALRARKQSPPILQLEHLSIERKDVLAWARRVKREAEKGRRGSLRPLQLLTLELSARLLLNDQFRATYCQSIKENPRIARGGFSCQDSRNGGTLFRSWGVVEIVPPHWDADRGRFSLLAPFPIPFVFWGDDLSDAHDEVAGLNNRLLLDYRPETSNHVVYVLACRKCGWLEGDLGGREARDSAVPAPSIQLRGLLLARWDPFDVIRSTKNDVAWPVFRRSKRNPYFEKLVDAFGEEVWGDGASRLAPPPPRSPRYRTPPRWPIGGDLSVLLGAALGRSLLASTESGLRHRLQILSWGLRQVECQVCRKVGGVRFLTRHLTYIDADASINAQTRLLNTLHRRLRQTRERIAKNRLLGSIFWIPADIPDSSTQHMAGRIGQVIRTASGERHPRRAPIRRIATWLGNIALESKEVWTARLDDTLDIVDESVARELSDLRLAVLAVVRDRTAGQVAGSIARLLDGARFGRVRELIVEHYTNVVWPRVPRRKAAKLRRNK